MKTKELNTYKVSSSHDVYADSYENGEGDFVNNYYLSSEIEATNWRDAIKKYFNDYLYFDVDFDYSYIDDDSNTFHYFNLVNDENMEANEREIEQWKENKLTLYSNHTEITVNQLINTNLK